MGSIVSDGLRVVLQWTAIRRAPDERRLSTIGGGLRVVLQWVAQRRREMIEELRQYNENMYKSMNVVIRRLRMKNGRPYAGMPNRLRNMLFGVPGVTTRGGQYWIERPNHNRAIELHQGWIRVATAFRQRIDDPDGEGTILEFKPYYFPGL